MKSLKLTLLALLATFLLFGFATGDTTNLQGEVGSSGPSGPSGPSGTGAGPTGPSGPTGHEPSGPSGPSGPLGPSGAQGLQGFSGPSGPSGPAQNQTVYVYLTTPNSGTLAPGTSNWVESNACTSGYRAVGFHCYSDGNDPELHSYGHSIYDAEVRCRWHNTSSTTTHTVYASARCENITETYPSNTDQDPSLEEQPGSDDEY